VANRLEGHVASYVVEPLRLTRRYPGND